MTILLIFLLLLLLIGLLLYWQLIIAEGAYLGVRVVTLLYDWTAERYNSIKEFEPEFEDWAIGEPLANRLHDHPHATVLDVATGTGRVPLNLLRQPSFQGHIVAVDRSAPMLRVAQRDLTARVSLVQADALALPFADQTFPVVSCLEALEFLPQPEKGLAELSRVLTPADAARPRQGWLLTSRRIGWEAWLMPGKVWSRAHTEQVLRKLGFNAITIGVWQDIYNIVWAQKGGRR